MNTNRVGWLLAVLLISSSFLAVIALSIIAPALRSLEEEKYNLLLNHPQVPIDTTESYTVYLPLVNKEAWDLVWNDEFSDSSGINTAEWSYDTGIGYSGGPSNWGTGEIEVMTSSLDNVFQSNGFLNIRVLHSGTNPLNGWTSGRIETERADFQPPINGQMAVEARIQLPNVTSSVAQGYWPAFWMLGEPYRGDYWNWPSVGEIDIVENINGLNQWWGVLHCGTNPGGPCHETTGLSRSVSGFAPTLQSDFHIYRVELDRSVSPQQLRWYVDGVQQHSVLSSDVDETTWDKAINHGFFIILNVAIGGGWAGNPTGSTASGGTMLVDYVRVYTTTNQ